MVLFRGSLLLVLLLEAICFVATRSQNVSTHESPLLSMYINIAKPGLGNEVLSEVVYKEHSLSGLFNSCAVAASDASEGHLLNVSSCYQDDQYNDRISFAMTYLSPGNYIEDSFAENPPVLDIIGESGKLATPEITETKVNLGKSTALVTVSYHCDPDSNGTLHLKLRLQFDEGDENKLSLLWTKVCKGGVNDNIEFGYVAADRENASPTHHSFSREDGSPLIVHPSDVSTEVYAKLGQAGAQQEFLAPFVTASNSEIVTISVRGNHPDGGVLKGLESNSFLIIYECLSKGSSDIDVTVGIPPFQNLTTRFSKGTCFCS